MSLSTVAGVHLYSISIPSLFHLFHCSMSSLHTMGTWSSLTLSTAAQSEVGVCCAPYLPCPPSSLPACLPPNRCTLYALVDPTVSSIGVTKLPFGHTPLMLHHGDVSCQTRTGKLSVIKLNSHTYSGDQGSTEEEVCVHTLHSGMLCCCAVTMREYYSFLSCLVEVIIEAVHCTEEVMYMCHKSC